MLGPLNMLSWFLTQSRQCGLFAYPTLWIRKLWLREGKSLTQDCTASNRCGIPRSYVLVPGIQPVARFIGCAILSGGVLPRVVPEATCASFCRAWMDVLVRPASFSPCSSRHLPGMESLPATSPWEVWAPVYEPAQHSLPWQRTVLPLVSCRQHQGEVISGMVALVTSSRGVLYPIMARRFSRCQRNTFRLSSTLSL